MDSLKTRFKHLKVRRKHKPAAVPIPIKQTGSSQSTALLLSVGSPPTPEARNAPDACQPASHAAATRGCQTNALTNERWSAQLWRQAFDAVKDASEWEDFCNIISRETGARLNEIDNQGDPSPQIEKVAFYAKQLVDSKAQATEHGLQRFLNKTMKTLQAVKSLGDAAVAFNPYAALGWNVIHFVISVTLKDHEVKEQACETLPRVAELTLMYQTWFGVLAGTGAIQVLRQQHDDVLIGIYTAVIKYQITVVISLCSKMTRLKHAINPEAKSQPQQALDELLRKEKQWESLRPIIDREITDAHFKEIRDSIQQLKSASATVLDELRHVAGNVDLQLRVKVLSWLSPTESEDAHTDPKRQPLPHTTDWLIKHPDYVSWSTDRATNCIWLQGAGGTGKSCLAHAVINDQRAKQKSDHKDSLVLFFYCDGTEKEQIDRHEKILRDLVKQLVAASSKPIPTRILQLYHEQRKPTEDDCLDLLLSMADASVELTIILDGIDECKPDVQREFIRCLQKLMSRRDQKLKVSIACRDTVALKNLLQTSTRKITVTEHTEGAIRIMVEATVEKHLQSPDLRFLYFTGSNDLVTKVIDKVTQMAGGMFRYAQIALDQLRRSKSPHFLKRRLESLNRLPGIDDLYAKEWQETVADLSDLERETVIIALNLLIYGFQYGVRKNLQDPSFVQNDQHILEACTLVLTGGLEDPFSIRSLVATCPSFLSESARAKGNDQSAPTESDVKLRIFHFSVIEYLVNQQSQWFNPGAANAAIARLCIQTFEHFDDPEILKYIFSQHPPNSLALYAVMCWPEHIRLCQKAIANGSQADLMSSTLRQFLLESFCSKPFDIWTKMMKKFRENIMYRCRGPAFQQGETLGFSFDPSLTRAQEDKLLVGSSLITQPPSSLFARLYLGFSIQEMDCPLSGVRGTWQYGGTTVTPQTFAATFGLLPAIDVLKKRGCSPNDRDDQGDTTGHVLCTYGMIGEDREHASFASTLRALVRAGLDLNIKDRKENTCFFHLLRSEDFDAEVLQIFQEQRFDFEAFEPAFDGDRDGMLPLDYAIAHIPHTKYRTRSLDALLSHYIKIYSDADSRTRWLRQAIMRNDEELVRLLIEKYNASPMSCDGLGLMALPFAVAFGWKQGKINSAIVDYLAPLTLKPGSNANSMNLVVPLLEALVAQCSLETVKLYMEYAIPAGSLYSAWGPRAMTFTLLFNKKHGGEIAEYLHTVGYENAGDSQVYQRWMRGELDYAEIGRCSEDEKYLDIDAIKEDTTLDEEFLDAPEVMGPPTP